MKTRPYLSLRIMVWLADFIIFVGLVALTFKLLKVPDDLPYWRALIGGAVYAIAIMFDRLFSWIRKDIDETIEWRKWKEEHTRVK